MPCILHCTCGVNQCLTCLHSPHSPLQGPHSSKLHAAWGTTLTRATCNPRAVCLSHCCWEEEKLRRPWGGRGGGRSMISSKHCCLPFVWRHQMQGVSSHGKCSGQRVFSESVLDS